MVAALEQLSEGVILADCDGRITFVNDAAARLHGVAQLDVPPELYAATYSLRTLDGDPYPPTDLPLARAVLRGETVLDARWTIRRPDGSELFALGSARPVLGADGQQVGAVLTIRDDTARVIAERTDELAKRALREMTERYRVLFESVDTGFAIIDIVVDRKQQPIDYRFIEVNAAFVEQTGLSDAVGQTALTLVPDLEQFWIDTYAHVADSGETMHFEHGSEAMGRWFEVSAVRMNAAARRVALLFRDITAERQAAIERESLLESLAQQRQRLVDVLRQTPGFFALLSGPLHIFEFVNEGYDQLVGHRKVFGMPVFEALPEAREQGFTELLDEVFSSGVPYLGRATPISLANTPGAPLEERYLDFTYAPMLDAQGEISGVIVHGVDVTDQVRARQRLEEAERQLRTLADAIPTLAWTAQADGYIDWYNAQWYGYTGATPAQMEGWGWQTVHDPDVLPLVLERWTASITSGEPFEMTFPLRGADGEFRSFLTRVVPSRDADGTITRWFGTNTDIEIEQRLRRSAEDANRAKSEFLAIMSHELRTPLNAIDGYAELMELGVRGPVTAEQQHDLARMRKSGKHLLGLINGVLNYAQVEAGAVHYEWEDILLDEVLTACQMLVAPLARKGGIELHRVACSPELAARADREKLQQILLNLLSNAIKFTDAGGRIELGCTLHEDEDAQLVQIQISDTGIGIAESQLARVFEPFVQVNSGLTRTRAGTGLGLAISRDLVRGMRGDLTVESTLGVGSTFTLLLPCA